MLKSLRYTICVLAVGGLIIVAVMLVLPKPPIPEAVKQQLTSTLLVPQGRQIMVDRDSVKYDAQLKLLSYSATAGNKKLIISEQPTPESFTDIPQAYDKLVETMRSYRNFDVDVGTVHLTRPKDLDGKQAAVLNTKGTLTFVKPATELSDDEWQRFFVALKVVR